jgi:NAD(P)-dependent dehydrogenase (short-subunit alcohol dehydrogenase family)
MAVYDMSKAAVLGLTRSLAAEYGSRGILLFGATLALDTREDTRRVVIFYFGILIGYSNPHRPE